MKKQRNSERETEARTKTESEIQGKNVRKLLPEASGETRTCSHLALVQVPFPRALCEC